MAELALDDHQRNALVRHLDRVRVAELMRREAAPYASGDSCQLLACGGLLPMPAGGRAMDHAQQGPDWQRPPEFEPRLQL